MNGFTWPTAAPVTPPDGRPQVTSSFDNVATSMFTQSIDAGTSIQVDPIPTTDMSDVTAIPSRSAPESSGTIVTFTMTTDTTGAPTISTVMVPSSDINSLPGSSSFVTLTTAYNTPTTTARPSSSNPNAAIRSTTTDAQPSSGSPWTGKLVGTAVGILAGIVVVLLLVSMCFHWNKRNRTKKKDVESSAADANPVIREVAPGLLQPGPSQPYQARPVHKPLPNQLHKRLPEAALPTDKALPKLPRKPLPVTAKARFHKPGNLVQQTPVLGKVEEESRPVSPLSTYDPNRPPATQQELDEVSPLSSRCPSPARI